MAEPKDVRNPGQKHVADDNHVVGTKADNGIKVTIVPRVPPGPTVGGVGGGDAKNVAFPANTSQNTVAGQTYGTGLPINVNR